LKEIKSVILISFSTTSYIWRETLLRTYSFFKVEYHIRKFVSHPTSYEKVVILILNTQMCRILT